MPEDIGSLLRMFDTPPQVDQKATTVEVTDEVLPQIISQKDDIVYI